MRGEIPPRLRIILRCQSGVVTRRQALTARLSPGVLASEVRSGRWQQLYRGVYAAFAGQVSREARLWAAVLYAGDGARLSHDTAAELYGLAEPAPLIHVTVPAARRVRPAAGLRIHICASDVRPGFAEGTLPCTRPEETVLDLVHGAASPEAARALVALATTRRLASAGGLATEMASRKRLRWRRQLAGMLAAAPVRAAQADARITAKRLPP